MKRCIKRSAVSTRIAGVGLGGRHHASSGAVSGRVVSRCEDRYSPEAAEGSVALQAQIGRPIDSTDRVPNRCFEECGGEGENGTIGYVPVVPLVRSRQC